MMAIAGERERGDREEKGMVGRGSTDTLLNPALTNKAEHCCTDSTNAVTKIEQTSSKGRKCDSEVEP